MRGEPTPALKYRLLPGYLEQISGNAAVYYGKVTAEETAFFGKQEWRDKVERWQELPLEELRREVDRVPLGEAAFDSLHRGARCKYCDWQLPIGDAPYYTILLPEAQQSRMFARVLAAEARIQIAHGRFDDAVKSFQAAYSLGRNVAEGETIVNGLIGIAICEVTFDQVLEFVQRPEAPNLYWALTTLPNPLIDMSDALDVEAMGVELSFPELRDLRTAQRTADEWRELFHRIARQVQTQISHSESPQPLSAEELDKRCEENLARAQQGVIASGVPAAEVATMPVHQVALLYSLLTYHQIFDDAAKHYNLPYPQAKAGIDAVAARAEQEKLEMIPIAAELLPALQVSRSALARNERSIAVLRVLEALRIYASGHDGKLPERLADIEQVPIPDDPVTGQPFEYQRDGEKARLAGPVFRDVSLNYEITMMVSK
jgi:hypothetical protein